jgi:hypothetical protein
VTVDGGVDTSPVRVHPAVEGVGIVVVAVAAAVPIARSDAAQVAAAHVLDTVSRPCGPTVLVAAGMGWVAAICLVTALWGAFSRDTVSETVSDRVDRVRPGQTPCATVFRLDTVRHPNTVISTVSTRSQHGRQHGRRRGPGAVTG